MRPCRLRRHTKRVPGCDPGYSLSPSSSLIYTRPLYILPPPSRKMVPSRLSRLLFIFLALAAPFTISSAQIAPVLDLPTELIPDGQPAPDNLLFLPLSGTVAKQRIDGLLVPSRLWSRQQEVTCTTNYSVCQGSQLCCPTGNVCCSGGFLPILGNHFHGGDVGDNS